MSQVELFLPDDACMPELGLVCYEAFRHLTEGHGFERDFPDPDTAVRIMELLRSLPGTHLVAARLDDRPVGSVFLLHTDEVGGLGPITVDPLCQGLGVGRRLVQAALDRAAAAGITRVRLLQDAYNTASFSLYASMGFQAREPIGVMKPAAGGEDASVRLALPADLEAMAALCRRLYGVARRRELSAWMERRFPILVREGKGGPRGYLVLGRLGHGVAESCEDALALVGQIQRHALPGLGAFLCPLRNAPLLRGALQAGCRLAKVMTLMTLGPYEDPPAVWMPSITF